ncbi:alpha/beta fold hydrolase [Euzebya sp.]|uniref:alpha/beta fold hydrolase n=1 Tax=Euzebya sp. TaxID=1971409 RepID=UPI003514AD97
MAPESTSRYVDVDGARLAVTDVGEGLALVALPAGVADRRVWRQAIGAWTADGWRVVAHDRRGFGESTWEPAPTEQPFSHVDDLVAVMDAVGVDRAVLVGNSQGGRIAVDTALAHPGRVTALVLIAPAVTGMPFDLDDLHPDELALEEAIEAAEEAGDLDAVNRLEAHLWLDGPREVEGRVAGAARDLFEDMNGRSLTAPPVGELRWGPSAWDRLDQIAVPTLVVVGELDEWPHVFAGLAERIPGAQLVTMPGSAHLPMLDDPEAFLDAVAPFLSDQR